MATSRWLPLDRVLHEDAYDSVRARLRPAGGGGAAAVRLGHVISQTPAGWVLVMDDDSRCVTVRGDAADVQLRSSHREGGGAGGRMPGVKTFLVHRLFKRGAGANVLLSTAAELADSRRAMARLPPPWSVPPKLCGTDAFTVMAVDEDGGIVTVRRRSDRTVWHMPHRLLNPGRTSDVRRMTGGASATMNLAPRGVAPAAFDAKNDEQQVRAMR